MSDEKKTQSILNIVTVYLSEGDNSGEMYLTRGFHGAKERMFYEDGPHDITALNHNTLKQSGENIYFKDRLVGKLVTHNCIKFTVKQLG